MILCSTSDDARCDTVVVVETNATTLNVRSEVSILCNTPNIHISADWASQQPVNQSSLLLYSDTSHRHNTSKSPAPGQHSHALHYPSEINHQLVSLLFHCLAAHLTAGIADISSTCAQSGEVFTGHIQGASLALNAQTGKQQGEGGFSWFGALARQKRFGG